MSNIAITDLSAMCPTTDESNDRGPKDVDVETPSRDDRDVDQDKLNPDVYLLWTNSPEYRKLFGNPDDSAKGTLPDFKAAAIFALGAAGICVVIACILWPIERGVSSDAARIVLLCAQALLLATAALSLLVVGFMYGAARRSYYERVKTAKSIAVDQAVFRLRRHPSLENLMFLNRRQLDDYHLSSTRQQSIAFRNAQIAAGIGFAVLVFGAALTVHQANDATGRYLTSGLSALGAALSAYVASVFFRSYRDTNNEMRAYYSEPFNTHQILMIERIANLDKVSNEGLRREVVMQLLAKFQSLGVEVDGPSASKQRPEPGEVRNK